MLMIRGYCWLADVSLSTNITAFVTLLAKPGNARRQNAARIAGGVLESRRDLRLAGTASP
jgi:hypothetical protein